MITFHADSFYLALKDLLQLEEESAKNAVQKGKEALSELDARRARFIIRAFFIECERAGLRRPLERQERLEHLGEPEDAHSKYTFDQIKYELEELRIAVFSDLREGTFLRLDDASAAYHEKPILFGDLVKERFPKAAYDIQEAGNCYATARYTGCVFHLMRVAEHGLRALAKKVGVPFPKTFDLKTWDELIRNIEQEIQKIILRPKTSRRSKDLEFYNTAAAQFRYFKDGWRNHVMHTRTRYDERQASSLMAHVHEFMQHLATKLKE